jgi:2-polyprenyl-3-methyl-5-hydroxy-6-metoxy-1,4-benzoquinol methylase
MLAPSAIPAKLLTWNQVHGAPYGYSRPRYNFLRRFYSSESLQKMRGPFGFQGNSGTRAFEYPWAYYAAELDAPKKVLEVGGSLSGLQFVLSREGHDVTNVDPGMAAAGRGWPSDQQSIARLNGWFGTSVRLQPTTIGQANLPDNDYDVFLAISVLEHLPEGDVLEVMEHANRCLKPGGRFIITLDLFLNLEPFSPRITNEWGRNQDVRWLVDASRMMLVSGERSELYGFPEFRTEIILANLEKYLMARHYPVLTQCLVLQKA